MAADQCAGIQVLGWLKLNDCPWGELSIELAREDNFNSDVLNWLQENGCPER